MLIIRVVNPLTLSETTESYIMIYDTYFTCFSAVYERAGSHSGNVKAGDFD